MNICSYIVIFVGAHMSNGSTPLCAPLQATPSSGVPSNPMISPGISPICGDNSSYKAKNKSKGYSGTGHSDKMGQRSITQKVQKLMIQILQKFCHS